MSAFNLSRFRKPVADVIIVTVQEPKEQYNEQVKILQEKQMGPFHLQNVKITELQQTIEPRLALLEQYFEARYADQEKRFETRYADQEKRFETRYADQEKRFEKMIDEKQMHFKHCVEDTIVLLLNTKT
jgi:hypothetical protein